MPEWVGTMRMQPMASFIGFGRAAVSSGPLGNLPPRTGAGRALFRIEIVGELHVARMRHRINVGRFLGKPE